MRINKYANSILYYVKNIANSLVKGLIIASLWDVRFGGTVRIPETKQQLPGNNHYSVKQKHTSSFSKTKFT